MDPNQNDDQIGQSQSLPQDDAGSQGVPAPAPEPTAVPEPPMAPDSMPGPAPEPGSGSEEPAVPPPPPVTGDVGGSQGPDSDSNPIT